MVQTINTSPTTPLTAKEIEDVKLDTRQADCEAKGGKWDAANQICLMPPEKSEITLEDRQDIIRERERRRQVTGESEQEAGRAIAAEREADIAVAQRAAEGEQLAQQIGTQPSPTEPSPGIVPGVSQAEALTVGAREAIPRALTLAGGAAIAGATAGVATGGVASIPLAVGAAAVTFTGTIAASMLSNMKSQRTDDTNAQQRVLDEGKQTLNDWVTLAAADPTRRQEALFQFNQQLQLIQNAHVQMLSDTNADVAKFEQAVPNLAEFSSFYNEGGERDALVAEMERALRGQMDFREVDFRMLALATQRDVNINVPKQETGFIGSLIP